MDVEALSLGAIERIIAVCPHLKAYFERNDKTPFTDGHIEIYRELPQKNDNRVGRVLVQVKGRAHKKPNATKVSWAVTRQDLEAFLQDSGVLYFHVRVHPSTAKCGVYYANLAPFRIAELLEKSKQTTRSVSVDLEPFPDEPELVESIVRIAHKTREQNPQTGIDAVLFERASGFTIYSATHLDFTGPTTLSPSRGDVSLVLHTSGGMNVSLPGEIRLTPEEYRKHRATFGVSSGGVKYDTVYRQRIDEASVRLSIGPCISMTFFAPPEERAMIANLELRGSVSDRLGAIDFMLGLNETGTIEVDGKAWTLGTMSGSDLGAELLAVRGHLAAIAQLFESLGVDSELIDLGTVSDLEMKQLQMLHRALVDKEELELERPSGGFVLQRLGRWNLVLLAVAGSKPGLWRIVDIFSPDFRMQFWARGDADDAVAHPVTSYDCIDQEHMPFTLNMRLASIVGAYEAVADWPATTFLAANHRVLELIAAADTCRDRRAEFLEAATDLNEWLLQVEGHQPHHLVNRWQILHREPGLSQEQRNDVRALKRQMTTDSDHALARHIEVACALLLGETDETEFLISRLDHEELSAMQKWPIWSLRDSVSSSSAVGEARAPVAD